MVTNTVKDDFMLTFEAVWQNGGPVHQVRAIATNLASKATAETQLSLDQIRKILEHAFNGELSIIEQQFEKVKTGYALPLETGSGTALVFTPPELLRFGFSHDDLEATERMLDR